MIKYFIKTPWWLRKLYSSYIWKIDTKEKVMYLTFDDGPHPVVTSFVLDELKRVNAKATFFCIGKNVESHPAIYRRILNEGHAVGNHTYNHLNGWKSSDKDYMSDISMAATCVDSTLFRPPYGRITSFQSKHVATAMGVRKSKIIMWDVLSADFDTSVTGDVCSLNVRRNAAEGSIVVFHDSEKAHPRLQICLPQVLDYFTEIGYRFDAIPV